ncbi:hypothetical protein TH53_18235 [Pedobacter lusitanus]|uniref:Uncharacterized protein n=1 Tax=Pedobacter lusitanus TaxID=1503925 RepID=A0A0D0FTT1_9SPHI|nr:hypothetical protein [Pedobacter lusitanus]KIO75834.1 hypothetical protein TH53_18235 [Pedobacter lusitanus]
MRVSLLLILLTTIFSCKNQTETKKVKGDLNYTAANQQSVQLEAALNLTANIRNQALQADLELKNPGNDLLTINDIELSTPEGIRSIPETGNMGSIVLKPGENKAISLKFHPLNDLREFQLSGRNGYFKSGYNLLINTKSDQDSSPSMLTIPAKLTEPEYKTYLTKYKIPATSYKFNTKTDFTAKQKLYLSNLKQLKQSPFVFLSDQEIAVSGINIRLSSYCEKDTLNAKLFIVNHADFPVRINPDHLGFGYTGESSTDLTNVKVIKISGSQEKNLIDKGDRVLIHLKKYFKNPDNKAVLSFNRVFEFSNGTPLFKDNVELIKLTL